MVQFVEYGEKLYRLLKESDGDAWLICWNPISAPFRVEDVRSLKKVDIPADFLEESEPSEKRMATMLKRLTILEPLMQAPDCIYDVKKRHIIIQDIASCSGISPKTVTRFYFAWLAKGERGLVPAPKIRNIQEDRRGIENEIRKAVNKYYYSPKRLSLRRTYEMYLMDSWKGADGCLSPNAPTFSQFRRVYERTRNDYRKVVSREGIGTYQRNYRPLLGSNSVSRCGLFEIDATEADICIVSRYSRKPIGRPIVYLAVDVATRLITGVHIGLSGGSKAILMCMVSMTQDKVEFCRAHGVDIQPEQWPSVGLPREIRADRGREFMSGRVREICQRFGIEITNLPPYRPELKGCVEKAFDCLQTRYKPLLRGYGTIETEVTREGVSPVQSRACLDLSEYTKILLRCIIHYNSSCFAGVKLESGMLVDKVPPVPKSLWAWLLEQKRCDLVMAQKEDVELMLMPRGEGRITRKGLVFNGLRYDSTDLNMTWEYVEAGMSGCKKVQIAYREDDNRTVYLIENGNYWEFKLTSVSDAYSGLSFREVELLKKEANELRKGAKHEQIEDAVRCSEFIINVVQNAEKTERHSRDEVRQDTMRDMRRKENTHEGNS